MSQIALALPFALPVAEFAPDLVRALNTPALAALLTRSASHARVPLNDSIRALPHEQWCAQQLDLAQQGRPAFAAAAMRGYGLAPQAGHWLMVHPVHVEIARTHLMLADPAQLGLSELDSRALFDAALPCFEEAGHTLIYGDANTWFMRADDWTELDTASLDAALGMDMTDWMPRGAHAQAARRLQNEVQVTWHTHPVNEARSARRLPTVNAFWHWAGADVAQQLPRRAVSVAAFDCAPWLRALASEHTEDLQRFASTLAEDTLLVCSGLRPYALSADWGGWISYLQVLENALFAPLLASLKNGSTDSVRLILSNRDAHLDVTTTTMAQRAFWRRPTLDRLL